MIFPNSSRLNPDRPLSWFPGYSWTVAHCSICHTHIGWKFQPVNFGQDRRRRGRGERSRCRSRWMGEGISREGIVNSRTTGSDFTVRPMAFYGIIGAAVTMEPPPESPISASAATNFRRESLGHRMFRGYPSNPLDLFLTLPVPFGLEHSFGVL